MLHLKLGAGGESACSGARGGGCKTAAIHHIEAIRHGQRMGKSSWEVFVLTEAAGSPSAYKGFHRLRIVIITQILDLTLQRGTF